MADSHRNVPAVRRDLPDRPPPSGQEAQTGNKVQKQQLVTQVQRDFPLVSPETVHNINTYVLGF